MARGGGAQGCKGSGTEPAGGDMRILTIRILSGPGGGQLDVAEW